MLKFSELHLRLDLQPNKAGLSNREARRAERAMVLAILKPKRISLTQRFPLSQKERRARVALEKVKKALADTPLTYHEVTLVEAMTASF